jgi:hypothetical protein
MRNLSMFSKLKLLLCSVTLASFMVLGFVAHSQAQTFKSVEGLPVDAMTQINEEMQAAALTGDTDALEELMTALAEANPELAKNLASFVSQNLPPDLSSDLVETLIVAAMSGIIGGAPEATADIASVVEANQPQLSDSVSSGLEAALLGMDFDTAAGGNDAGGLDNFDTAAGGPAAAPRAPARPALAATTASITAESPTTASASPTG